MSAERQSGYSLERGDGVIAAVGLADELHRQADVVQLQTVVGPATQRPVLVAFYLMNRSAQVGNYTLLSACPAGIGDTKAEMEEASRGEAAIYLEISKYFEKKIGMKEFFTNAKTIYFISESLFSWLRSNLTDRTQRVRVGDAFSTTEARFPLGPSPGETDPSPLTDP